MILKVYTIYDKAVEAYLQPFFSPTMGSAIRALTDTMNLKEGPFSAHPEDYTLFAIGEYDDLTGEIAPHEPTKIIPLSELLR